MIRGAGGFVPNAPEEEDAPAPLPPLIRGAGGFVSNPSEEEDNLASIETEDDFLPDDHDVDRLFDDVVDDMNLLNRTPQPNLSPLLRRSIGKRTRYSKKDDKLQQLLKLLKEHTNEKVLIFTEFCDTARYLYKQLHHAGFTRY